jgi:hypothetical protein
MFAGRFDGHVDALVRCGVHRPMDHDQGFMLSHWTSPSGECRHRIAPAAAMVIDGADTTNTTKNTTFS